MGDLLKTQGTIDIGLNLSAGLVTSNSAKFKPPPPLSPNIAKFFSRKIPFQFSELSVKGNLTFLDNFQIAKSKRYFLGKNNSLNLL